MKSRLAPDSWLLTRPIAHRGLHNDTIAENSFEAFSNAINGNYPIEMDVQMTSDGKLVVFHDDNLMRMTGLDADIRKTDYQTIKSLHLKETSSYIPDFSEFLAFVGGRVPLLIEIKQQLFEGIEEKVLDELKDYQGEFAIQSFDPILMKRIKKLNPNIIRGQLGCGNDTMHSKFIRFALKWLPLNGSVKPDFINYDVKSMPISRLITKNLPVLGWTVRTDEERKKAETYAKGYVFEHIFH